MSLPILATLAVGAGVVVAGAGVVALPVYGSYKLHKYLQRKKALKGKRDRRREVWRAREVDDVADFMNGLINAGTASTGSTDTYSMFNKLSLHAPMVSAPEVTPDDLHLYMYVCCSNNP